MANFFLIFQDGGHLRAWIFEIVKFYCVIESRALRCTNVPNFVEINHIVFEILRFFDYSGLQPFTIWISLMRI